MKSITAVVRINLAPSGTFTSGMREDAAEESGGRVWHCIVTSFLPAVLLEDFKFLSKVRLGGIVFKEKL